ncbi:GntR family transcriptional regulator [Flavonifractor sp. An91]|uniref:GntR family transcriptional regulator n=1 Tax=Flavonifractor sp. An91 TaxID=1965665 RepID=UPI000B38ABFF|nr:GntR family transcriptional regulator [Flavonifractor sp. An91]OUN14630.1 GntR family transcriptional regulator [Flavonifractor sp. An91]
MCNFGGFVPADGLPIYLQIVRYVERGVAAGTIADGEELPSRRVLSAQLGVNPNTVQKAYRLLEEEGLITSRSGAKSEVCAPPEQAAALRTRLLEQEIAGFIRSLRQSRLEKEAALELIDRLWDRKEEDP